MIWKFDKLTKKEIKKLEYLNPLMDYSYDLVAAGSDVQQVETHNNGRYTPLYVEVVN